MYMFRLQKPKIKTKRKRLVYNPNANMQMEDYESGFSFPERIIRVSYEEFSFDNI